MEQLSARPATTCTPRYLEALGVTLSYSLSPMRAVRFVRPATLSKL
jgi:hypothetical protein